MSGEADKELAGPHFLKRGQIYTQEDLDAAMGEAASRAAEMTARKLQNQSPPQYQQPQYQPPPSKRRRREEEEDTGDDEGLMGINPRFVKQLQNTVGVFNALKEFATNPLQKAIENRVGDVAASVVENAFAPRGPPPKKELVDTILNSQFAYGLGAGLGQRAPELVETLSKSFGHEKTEQMIDAMIGKYGKGGDRQLTTGGSQGGNTNQDKEPPKEQSNIELLLSLDPNNPEHVAAYAESQGGIKVETARKMLMIHQDDIIDKMKSQKGETYPTPPQREQYQQPTHTYQESPIKATEQVPQNPGTNPGINSNPGINPGTNPGINSNPGIEYAEFQDVPKNNITQNNEQLTIMKTFTEEIGKVMESMVGRIESLSNSVQMLEKELIEVKNKQIPQAYTQPTTPSPTISPPIRREIIEPIQVNPPINIDMIDRPLTLYDINTMNIEDLLQPSQQPFPQQEILVNSSDVEIKTKQQLLKELEDEAKTDIANKKVEEKKVEETKIENKEIEVNDTHKVEIEEKNIIEKPRNDIIENQQKKNVNENLTNIEQNIPQEEKVDRTKDIEPVKDKVEETKRFVTPIRKNDVHKKFSPSMKNIENK